MNTTSTNCPDVLMSGNCTRGEDCVYCKNDINVELNVNARNWVPKSKRVETDQKLQLNLEATEYKPKFEQSQLTYEVENLDINEEEPEEDEEYEGEEFDMIMKDIINNEVMEEMVDDDESDDEKWFPKYKDCECCKGFVYKCNGVACVNMGACYCKMKEECDDEEIDS